MDTIEAKLKELGLTLPPAPTPAGSYVPFRMSGNTLYLAGTISTKDGVVLTGQIGKDRTIEEGFIAAQACALNALASAKAALGSLERVRELLIVNGFVNGIPGFADSPQVINGASELFLKVFGEAGKHARVAVGAGGLPRNALVEIQVTLRFE